MAIIKSRNKKTGILYVYESESYWDKEKQQPRSRRKLIGKVDEQTGEIIPTGKRGKETSKNGEVTDGIHSGNTDSKQTPEDCLKRISDQDAEILELRRKLAEKEIKLEKLEAKLKEIRKLVE